MRLLNPTDDELNAAFAEKVAGWVPPSSDAVKKLASEGWVDADQIWIVGGMIGRWPHWKKYAIWTTSADAVLPWLEKCGAFVSLRYWDGEFAEPRGWYLSLWENDEGGKQIGDYVGNMPLPRAACIALLRAHGVEVTFT